jgi:hypothetical protein
VFLTEGNPIPFGGIEHAMLERVRMKAVDLVVREVALPTRCQPGPRPDPTQLGGDVGDDCGAFGITVGPQAL